MLGRATDRANALVVSNSQKPFEKGSIAPQCQPQAFGGRLVGLVKFTFEGGALIGKRLRQTLNDLGDEFVSGAYGLLGVIDEASLYDIPPRAEIRGRVLGKEWGEL